MFSLSLRRAQKSVCTACRYRGVATSTPTTPNTSPKSSADASQKPGSTTIPTSSCPADTILPGVNYLKGQEPVLAKPDEWYPEWLWTVLEPKKIEYDGPGGKYEKMQRRRDNKQKIKERNFMSTQ
ncbi:hypothetical protein AAF712_013692 [Marasmius tenuissimus]|uniref:Large ribosomal subunit protein mL54 n=1 Tax=Marasmius tenuissimus TaxID=585030 RepID=A0ABR2ZGF6_9AGAR|nr:hypothetical protein PM082_011874 [Marasmius tenuissimus]